MEAGGWCECSWCNDQSLMSSVRPAGVQQQRGREICLNGNPAALNLHQLMIKYQQEVEKLPVFVGEPGLT